MSNTNNHIVPPQSYSPPQMSSLQPSSTTSHYSSRASSNQEPFSLRMVPTPLNHSTPVSIPLPSSSHMLPLLPTPLNYSNPNPIKTRNAHNTKSGISPLKMPAKLQTVKVEKGKSTKIKPKIAPPPQLSPIKSPKVLKEPSISTSSAAPNTARAKILASGFAPQAVEPQVTVVGGKLNQAQLEAAKRRSIPSAPHLPSINGFRQSANEMKAASKVNTTSNRKVATDKADKKPHNNPEEFNFCPSRRRTNPSKVSASSSSELNLPSDASSLSEKSREGATGFDGPKNYKTESSENSELSSVQVDNSIKEPINTPKSQSVPYTKIKSKEFISTEESSDDDGAVAGPVNGISKKSVVSFDEVSLTNSSHEVSTPVKGKSSELKKRPIKRSESLDEDLDISDSDDDNREDLGPLIDSLGSDDGGDQAHLNSNEAVSNEGDEANKLSKQATKGQNKTIAASEDILKQERSLSDESDDDDNSSSERFSRLKSESKPVPVGQLQDVQVRKENVEQVTTAIVPVTRKQKTFRSQLEELIFHFKSRTDDNCKKLHQEREKLSKERSG